MVVFHSPLSLMLRLTPSLSVNQPACLSICLSLKAHTLAWRLKWYEKFKENKCWWCAVLKASHITDADWLMLFFRIFWESLYVALMFFSISICKRQLLGSISFTQVMYCVILGLLGNPPFFKLTHRCLSYYTHSLRLLSHLSTSSPSFFTKQLGS